MDASSVTRAIPEGDEPSGAGAEQFWGSGSERGVGFGEVIVDVKCQWNARSIALICPSRVLHRSDGSGGCEGAAADSTTFNLRGVHGQRREIFCPSSQCWVRVTPSWHNPHKSRKERRRGHRDDIKWIDGSRGVLVGSRSRMKGWGSRPEVKIFLVTHMLRVWYNLGRRGQEDTFAPEPSHFSWAAVPVAYRSYLTAI